MRELNVEETASVNGSAAPALLALLGFVWHEAEHIEEFVEGVFHGLED